MKLIQETDRFKVRSDSLGALVQVTRKSDGARVTLEGEDAADLLDKLKEASSSAVQEFWIDAWSSSFVVEGGVARPAPVASAMPSQRRKSHATRGGKQQQRRGRDRGVHPSR